MSMILDDVNAENLEELRKEQKSVLKNLLKEREKAVVRTNLANEDLVNVAKKITLVSNMNEETFKESKFREQEIWGKNPFFKAWEEIQFKKGKGEI